LLDHHYAAISTTSYQQPWRKETVTGNVTEVVSEWRMFNILDNLRATATGLDQLPAWFLRLGAPLFHKSLTYLFNVSISKQKPSAQCLRYITCQPLGFSPDIYHFNIE